MMTFLYHQLQSDFWACLLMINTIKKFFVRSLILTIASINIVYAQQEGGKIDGVRIFEPGYFEEFDPVTALDMVDRTPGFDAQEQSGGRGLSEVRSNILINGERPPPKGQSARQQLDDIPYTNVTRIELVDTTASLDIDMQGYPQIVNVILEDEPSDYYELIKEYRKSGTGGIKQRNERENRINATGSFSLGAHEFSLRGGTEDRNNRSPANLVDIDPANPEQRFSSQNLFKRQDQYLELNSIFNLAGNSSLSINAELNNGEQSSKPLILLGGVSTLNAVNQNFSNEDDWQEISGEYRRSLGDGGELMFALVDSLSTDGSNSSLAVDGLLRSSIRKRESGETAARLLITNKLSDRLTVRATATTAYNYFEGVFEVLENGILLPIGGTNSRVEEDRHSLEFDADWTLSDQWIFRASINTGAYSIDTHEVSKGMQSESKGFLSIAYQLQERRTITFESRHEIGQLSFGQFLASSNLSSEILKAGASDLEAERQWIHSINYDNRFGDRGVLKLSLVHLNVENPVRSVALSDTVLVSQNTSSQKVTQLDASIEYPFERFNYKDLVLNAAVTIEDSETIDPITGEKTSVSWASPYQWSVGLRKNPGEGRLTWGLNLWNRASNDNYSVRQIREQSPNREWRIFAEWEIKEGLKLQGRIDGRRKSRETSTFYSSVRQTGLDPSFISTLTNQRGRSARIALEWRRKNNLEITAIFQSRAGIETEESLRAFGDTSGSFLAREIARTPRVTLRFRLYR